MAHSIILNNEEYSNQIGTTHRIQYRSIQAEVKALHIEDVTLVPVPNGVGARGRAFGLRNSEIAFPRTVHIGNVTCVAPPSEREKLSLKN